MICYKHTLLGIESMMSGMNPSFSSLIWEDHNHSPSAISLQLLLQLVTGYMLVCHMIAEGKQLQKAATPCVND